MKTFSLVALFALGGFAAGCATLPPVAATHPASAAADEAQVPATSTLARAAQGPLFAPDPGDSMKDMPGMAGMKDGSCGGGR